MGYFVRMLSRGKWAAIEDFMSAPADTLQSELRTSKNTLSLWYINDLMERQNAILALASARDKIDRLDILCIEESLLTDFDIERSPDTGLSPFEEFNENHYDIRGVNYDTLGKMSKIILSNLDKAERITAKTVTDILKDAFLDEKLNKETLNDSLKAKIQQKLS